MNKQGLQPDPLRIRRQPPPPRPQRDLLHESTRDEDGEGGRARHGEGRRRGARSSSRDGRRRWRHAQVHLLRRRRGEQHGRHGHEQQRRAGRHRRQAKRAGAATARGWRAAAAKLS